MDFVKHGSMFSYDIRVDPLIHNTVPTIIRVATKVTALLCVGVAKKAKRALPLRTPASSEHHALTLCTYNPVPPTPSPTIGPELGASSANTKREIHRGKLPWILNKYFEAVNNEYPR